MLKPPKSNLKELWWVDKKLLSYRAVILQ